MTRNALLPILASATLLAGCAGPAGTPSPIAAPPTATAAPTTVEPSPTERYSPTAPQVTPAPPTAAPTLVPLSLSSDPAIVRQRMLHSHDNWHSIFVELEITEYPPQGSNILAHFRRLQAWVRQPAQALILSGPLAGPPMSIFVSDGTRYYQADLATDMTYGGDIPPFAFEPFVAPEGFSDTIYPHPFGSMLGYPAAELIFPTALAQRQGVYKVVGTDNVAGREALIVDWTAPTGVIADRFRVDAITGVLLRQQNLGKTGGGEIVQTDIVVTRIVFDPEIPDDVFTVERPGPLQYLEPPPET